jgi:hypothetical protein
MAVEKVSQKIHELVKSGLQSGQSKNDIIEAMRDAGYNKTHNAAEQFYHARRKELGIKSDTDLRIEQSLLWFDEINQGAKPIDVYTKAKANGFEYTYSAFTKRIATAKRSIQPLYSKSSVAVKPRYGRTHELDRQLESAMHYFSQANETEKSKPILNFGNSPICLVFMGDQHIGNKGTDYDRMWREATIVSETEGMYCIQGGDLVDNYVIGRLSDMRAKSHTRMTIDDEWHLAADYLALFGDKIKAVVGGNHDKWTAKVSGIDYLSKIVRQFMSTPVYDSDDLTILVNIGDWPIRLRVRHKWKSSSKLNPTHGIEDFYRHNGGFDVGVGFHTHTGGFSRAFLGHEGSNCLAVQCGAYKRVDSFAKECGFPASNRSTAMAVIFDPEHKCYFGVDNLETAARIMGMYYD